MEQRSLILIVDDHPLARETLAALLEPEGYQLAFAASGPEALAQARALTPDLVLLDVMMPGMDGFEVCRRLRDDPELALVPVIVVTALDDPGATLRALEAGADDFLGKPFNRAELRARVRTVTRLNRYRRLLDEQARLAAERTRFRWVVDHADDAYLILSAADELRYANPPARRLLRLPLDDERLPGATFLDLAGRHYRCEPAEAWEGWPRDKPYGSRYLVQPETRSTSAVWLQVDRLDLPDGSAGESVVRLRDVSEQVVSLRSTWTLHALISHKLRTPLGALYGGVTMLASYAEKMPREKLRDIARLAVGGVESLRDSVDEILGHVGAPAVAPAGESFALAALPELCRRAAAAHGLPEVAVALAPGAERARLVLAPASVELVLGELFENARKFHPRHEPHVTVDAALTPDGAAIRVADDGATLTPSQLARAFQPYYQGEKGFTGQVAGMGLGLATVSRLLWGVGGSCAIANRPDGPGVVIELRVPLEE
ncbi:MAG TPA: response regulator [Roseiflexaceae bacterium]|nr:response regulator [Roseiflexaceae bacterium]